MNLQRGAGSRNNGQPVGEVGEEFAPLAWPVSLDTLTLGAVGFLSNFLGRSHPAPPAGDPAAPNPPVRCHPAQDVQEIHDGLALVLGEPGRPADGQQIADFAGFAAQRGIDLGGLWVAERDGRPLWALLPVVSPGRTMLLLSPTGAAPEKAAAERAEAGGALIDAVCRHFARPPNGVRLAQVLLDPADGAGRALYVSRGFREMAELLYLHGNVSPKSPPPPAGPRWALQTYSPATHPRFAAAIAASYHASLDCPELNGVRDIEDIVAGHKSSGVFDPAWWFLLCERVPVAGSPRPLELPRGVLLLSRAARGDAAELVYLGLVPEARGRGLGDWAMRHAMHALAAAGVARLCLAVDARNAPALKLYHRFGLQPAGCKVAMMRTLG